MRSDVLEQPDDLRDAGPEPALPMELSGPNPQLYRTLLTAIAALGPIFVAAVVLVRSIGEPIPWFEIALAGIFLAVIGHGVTIGFHRLFTHRSFEASRPLKITLAVLGSMSFQG